MVTNLEPNTMQIQIRIVRGNDKEDIASLQLIRELVKSSNIHQVVQHISSDEVRDKGDITITMSMDNISKDLANHYNITFEKLY